MDSKDFIERVRRAREEEVRFFSNPNREERERWVVREFLRTLLISLSDDELHSPKQSDDVDVVFRDANFQVKELPEANCRRSSEVRAALERAETATQPMELYEPLVAEEFIWVDAYPFIQQYARDRRYTPASRAMLDLLVYVTRPHAVLDRATQQPSSVILDGDLSLVCSDRTLMFWLPLKPLRLS